ncbi:MAG: hypothetical protein NTX82_00135 [Candidatus Parcubacteria bacterium]|nr:hypothetical protein [Candidatus Parcubacteria bacterium]
MVNKKKSHFANQKKVAVILGDPRLPDLVKKDGKFNPEDLKVVSVLKDALRTLPDYKFIYLNNHRTLQAKLKTLAGQVSLVLNLCDEGWMNNPVHEDAIPIFLEKLGLPYTGARAKCMRLCYDKKKVLVLAADLGIGIPYSYGSVTEVNQFPAIVKPNKGDGGIGITAKGVAYSRAELEEALADMQKKFPRTEILIQEFLSGKDLSLGILGNPPHDFQILPVIEDDYSALPKNLPPIAGYESKWLPDSLYWQLVKSKPVFLPEKTLLTMVAQSIMLFSKLGCHDYARFDWRLDAMGQPRLLEANPNPGWCHDGHLAKMSALAGLRYSRMLEKIILSAFQRYVIK